MTRNIKYDFYYEERDEKILIIFPEKPFWLVGDFSIKVILEYFKGNIKKQQLHEELTKKYEYDFEEIEQVIQELKGILEEAKLFEEESIEQKETVLFENNFPNPVINVTRRCNLSCKHCYAEAGEKWDKEELTTSEIMGIIDQIFENYNLADFDKRILLSGGEPFLRKDIIEIISYIKVKGGTPLVNTNGLLIHEDDMDKLRNYKAELLISLDGGTKESHEFLRGKGTFNRTVDKIKQLKAHNVITKVSMTVHRNNLYEIENFVRLAESLNVDGIAVNMVNILARAKECGLERVKLTEFNKEIKRVSEISPKVFEYVSTTDYANLGAILLMNLKFDYCGVGAASLVIDYNGDLYPCYNNMNESCKLGNIKKDHLVDIWKHSKILKELRSLNVNDFSEKCRKCPVKYYCGGGCRGEAFFANESFYSSCPYCEDMREGIIELMFEIAKRDTEIFKNRIKYYNSVNQTYLRKH